jgi:hypothetical protein
MESVPEFKAFKFQSRFIGDKMIVPVVVKTTQGNSASVFETAGTDLAKPKFYPTVKFNEWFDKVVSLTPNPRLETISMKMCQKEDLDPIKVRDGFYSSGLDNEESYAIGFIDIQKTNNSEVFGIYQGNDKKTLYQQSIELMPSDNLSEAEKTKFEALIAQASNLSSTPSSDTEKISFKFQVGDKLSSDIVLIPGVPKSFGRDFFRSYSRGESGHISSDHIELLYQDGKLFIRDLSLNGTHLEQKKLQKSIWYKLEANQSISIPEISEPIKLIEQ